MWIKPRDEAALATLSLPPAPNKGGDEGTSALSANAALSTRVSLSGSVRALCTALLETANVRLSPTLYALLSASDHELLASALALIEARGLPARELGNLLLDVLCHRGAELATSKNQTPQDTPLALPRFSAQDEALAREILDGLLRCDPQRVDHAFVQRVVDPDAPARAQVGFGFMRALLETLMERDFAQPNAPRADLARRSLRETLSRTIAALALPRSALDAASTADLRRGLESFSQRASLRCEPGPARGLLSRNERTLLALLYAAAEAQALPLESVDQVVDALIALRRLDRAQNEAPSAPDPRTAVAHAPRAPHADRPPPLTELPSAAASRNLASLAPSGPTATLHQPLPFAHSELGPTTPREAPAPPSGSASQRAQDAAPHEPPPSTVGAADATAFGSASQRLARLQDAYASLTPPAARSLPVAASIDALHVQTRQVAADATLLGAPGRVPLGSAPVRFDLAQAFGLGPRLSELRARLRRGVRARSAATQHAVRPIPSSRGAVGEAEADDPFVDLASRRRRVRWELLARRRRQRAAARH